jgi:hypothetical protein
VYGLIITTIISGCYKEIDEFIPKLVIAPGDYNQAFNTVQEEPQTFMINNSQDVILYLENAQIFINQGSFTFQDGSPVQGEIDITVSEHYENHEFLKNNLPTVTTIGELLGSHAVFFINARQNGKQLKLKENNLIQFNVPDELATDLSRIFSLNEDPVSGEKAWELLSSGGSIQVGSWWNQEKEQEEFGYIFDVNELDWISISEFLDYPNLTDICVTLPESNTSSNTRVFLLYDNINSVQPLWINQNGTKFCTVNAVSPVEFEATIVVIAHKGGDYYETATQRIIVLPGLNIELTPHKVTEIELRELLNSL